MMMCPAPAPGFTVGEQPAGLGIRRIDTDTDPDADKP
jgi:hypothetical protein